MDDGICTEAYAADVSRDAQADCARERMVDEEIVYIVYTINGEAQQCRVQPFPRPSVLGRRVDRRRSIQHDTVSNDIALECCIADAVKQHDIQLEEDGQIIQCVPQARKVTLGHCRCDDGEVDIRRRAIAGVRARAVHEHRLNLRKLREYLAQ